MNDSIYKYIDDPYFLKWIFEPDPFVEKYWDDYMKKHKDESQLIMKIREKLLPLRIKNKRLTDKEKNELFLAILCSKKKNRSLSFRKMSLTVLKYAAIVIFLISLGGASVYFFLNNKSVQYEISPVNIAAIKEKPKLIMSDGTDVTLQKESSVQFKKNNELIIDNKKVKVQTATTSQSAPVIAQVVIPYGSRSKVILNDGTAVYLNAGSRLVHPTCFEKNKREVHLFGEAFFEVTKDKKRPFVVKTNSIAVEVLGTKFNVSAYPDDRLIQTVLEEGSVSIKRKDATLFEKKVILKPNEMLSFNTHTNESTVTDVNPELYTYWRHGLLKFDNQQLSEITKKLERYYNIKIEFENKTDGYIKINGKLDLNSSKPEIFEYLSFVANVNITKQNEQHYLIK